MYTSDGSNATATCFALIFELVLYNLIGQLYISSKDINMYTRAI